MNIKDDILDILNDPSKLEGINNETDYIKQVSSTLLDVYRIIAPDKRVSFAIESGAFALAKAMESKLLEEIRPESKHCWLVIMEIAEGAKFNLPSHLEDKLYDYMDACENAISEYIESNLAFDFQTLLTQLQNIGSYLVDKDDLKNLTHAGLTNDQIMTRDELHNFCIQGAAKALTERNYKILNIHLGSAQPINIVCEQGGIIYNTTVLSAILPKTGTLEGWRLREVEKVQQDDTHKTAIIGVSIIPTDELYASMGVAIKEGEYNFKVAPLETITPRKEK